MEMNLTYMEKAGVKRYQGAYSELVRKSIHMSVALVPAAAAINLSLTMAALAMGVLFYSWTELMRLSGYRVPLVTEITHRAARGKDADGMVLGPVTLAVGAMLALMLYPDPVSTIAVYALAFGDGFASLVGKLWGRISLPLNGGKTVEGSLACFAAVFLAIFRYFPNPSEALLIAGVAMFIESFDLGDMDNIVMPFGVGLIAGLFLT